MTKSLINKRNEEMIRTRSAKEQRSRGGVNSSRHQKPGEDTNTNTRIQIWKYKYSNANAQIQIFHKESSRKKGGATFTMYWKRDNCITRNQMMIVDKIQQNEKFGISDLIWEKADRSGMIIREWKFLCTTAKDLWNKVQLWEKRKGRQCQFSDDHFWSKVELS